MWVDVLPILAGILNEVLKPREDGLQQRGTPVIYEREALQDIRNGPHVIHRQSQHHLLLQSLVHHGATPLGPGEGPQYL